MMTATTASSTATREATTSLVLRRAASAEWTRLRTVRSTWWCLLAATALMVVIGAAAGSGHTGPEPAPIWQAAQVAMVPAQFAFLLVVLLAGTSDYSTGAIRSTLLWVPRREVLLAARTTVTVAFATGSAVVSSAVTGLVAWAFLGSSAEIVVVDIAASLARIALVVSFGGFLAVGLGLALRSTAGALTSIFLLMFILVVTLGNSGVPWLVTISDHLPGRAVISLLVVDEAELPATTAAIVMVAWAAAALGAGGWSLLRRDTT